MGAVSCLEGDFGAVTEGCVDDVVGCFEMGGDGGVLADCDFTGGPPATLFSPLAFGEEVVAFEAVVGDEPNLTGSFVAVG